MTKRILFYSVLLISVSVGCGRNDGRDALSGKASFNGQPIAYGEIVFHPEQGPEGSATIRDGRYDTSIDGGRGITRGPNTLLITGYETEPVAVGDETATIVNAPPLFSSFELKAELSSDTFDIEVPAEAAKK